MFPAQCCGGNFTNKSVCTCDVVKAGFVKGAHEKLEANDGVNDDDEEDKEGDVD